MAMMRVTVDMAAGEPALTVGTPEALFDYRYRAIRDSQSQALSPDDERLLMMKEDALVEGTPSQPQIHVILNWFEDLTRLFPDQ